MKIGELVRQYRHEHNLSLRDFADISGISNGYLCLLEHGYHPKTKKPIVPTLTKLNQIAAAMHIGVDDLIASVDDMNVSLSDDPNDFVLSMEERELIISFRSAPADARRAIAYILKLKNGGGENGSC